MGQVADSKANPITPGKRLPKKVAQYGEVF